MSINDLLEIVKKINKPFFEVSAVCFKSKDRYILYILKVELCDNIKNTKLYKKYDSVLFYRETLQIIDFNSFLSKIVNKNWTINDNDISFELMTEPFIFTFIPRRNAKDDYKIDYSCFRFIQTGTINQDLRKVISNAAKELALLEVPYSDISDASDKLLSMEVSPSISPHIIFLAPLSIRFRQVEQEKNLITVNFEFGKFEDPKNYKVNIYGIDNLGNTTNFRFSKNMLSLVHAKQIKILKNTDKSLSKYDIMIEDKNSTYLKFELYYNFHELYLSEDFFEKLSDIKSHIKILHRHLLNIEQYYKSQNINCEIFDSWLSQHESRTLEFKSSMLSKEDGSLGDVFLVNNIIMGMASFFNTEGGILIIGVNPQREVIGIEKDYAHLTLKNIDGWQKYLTDKISSRLKDNTLFSSFKIFYKNKRSHDIIIILIKKHRKPVVYFENNQNEIFIIRSTNSRKRLSLSETIEYTRTHWPSTE